MQKNLKNTFRLTLDRQHRFFDHQGRGPLQAVALFGYFQPLSNLGKTSTDCLKP